MAMERFERIDGEGGGGGGRVPGPAPGPAPEPDAPPVIPETGGSTAPPADAGDDQPDRSFPVPPVPPPPSAGPIFSLAGEGGGGPTSFARPGTEAAKPFRSPLFATNRATSIPGAGGAARFGAGTALTAGGGGSPAFLPAGLGGEGDAQGAPADELQRILEIMRGQGGARF